jgi:hypothetical protein
LYSVTAIQFSAPQHHRKKKCVLFAYENGNWQRQDEIWACLSNPNTWSHGVRILYYKWDATGTRLVGRVNMTPGGGRLPDIDLLWLTPRFYNVAIGWGFSRASVVNGAGLNRDWWRFKRHAIAYAFRHSDQGLGMQICQGIETVRTGTTINWASFPGL